MFQPILEKIASELYTTDEEKTAFLAGFQKEAQAWYDTSIGGKDKSTTPMDEAKLGLGKGIGEGVARGATGLAAALLGAGIVKGIGAVSNHMSDRSARAKFEQALAHAMTSHKVVRGSNPERVKSYAETVFKFAPSVAGDQNLLSTILANALEGTEGMDPMSIKMLVDLESRHAQPADSRLPGIRT